MDHPDATAHNYYDVQVTADAQTGSCTYNSFSPAVEASNTTDYGLEYKGMTNANPPFDHLEIQVYQGTTYNGPTAPGDYALTGANSNFETCGLCLLLYQNCTTTECEKTFYADTGTVHITSIGGIGTTFAATFENVIFREVTIDWSSYVSTPVTGGDTWCFDNYGFSEEVVDENAALCGQSGVNCVGETIPDFSLQNCQTEQMVSVYDMAAGNKALWFVGTHVWCPACAEYVPDVISTYDQQHANGLNVAIVVGEDANGGQIDLDECRAYAAQYDSDASLFYIDHDGTVGHATLFSNLYYYPAQDQTIGFPWNAVMDAQTHEYVYADGAGGDLNTTLNGLLQ